jgi:bifunctional DNA-binding transcriptional regulator/antitoxin component of YhaV-PrlF toxin-antitoxin module
VPQIEVTEQDGAFHVVVGGTSAHEVIVPDGYADRLGINDRDATALVRESFMLLLEREPKESILRSFSLDVIERYFPEYADEIVKRLK